MRDYQSVILVQFSSQPVPRPHYNAAIFHTPLIDRVSGYGPGTFGGPLDHLSNGRVPGCTASGPERDGKANELLWQGPWEFAPMKSFPRSHREDGPDASA